MSAHARAPSSQGLDLLGQIAELAHKHNAEASPAATQPPTILQRRAAPQMRVAIANYSSPPSAGSAPATCASAASASSAGDRGFFPVGSMTSATVADVGAAAASAGWTAAANPNSGSPSAASSRAVTPTLPGGKGPVPPPPPAQRARPAMDRAPPPYQRAPSPMALLAPHALAALQSEAGVQDLIAKLKQTKELTEEQRLEIYRWLWQQTMQQSAALQKRIHHARARESAALSLRRAARECAPDRSALRYESGCANAFLRRLYITHVLATAGEAKRKRKRKRQPPPPLAITVAPPVHAPAGECARPNKRVSA